MANTYSPSLKLELIGNGDQSGTWGTTTNNNLGNLLEQAITGVQVITMLNADYILTNYNGALDEARNAVLVAVGTNSAIRNIIAPSANKLYVVTNNTSGGYDIVIKTTSSVGVTIPNGITTSVYCDGSEFYYANPTFSSTNTPTTLVLRDSSGNFAANIITANINGNLIGSTPTAPTAAPGTSTNQIATTAFVQNVAGNLGTMSTQNANNVNITGGTLSGVTVSGTNVGTNASGNRTVSTGTPTGGSNGDIWYQY